MEVTNTSRKSYYTESHKQRRVKKIITQPTTYRLTQDLFDTLRIAALNSPVAKTSDLGDAYLIELIVTFAGYSIFYLVSVDHSEVYTGDTIEEAMSQSKRSIIPRAAKLHSLVKDMVEGDELRYLIQNSGSLITSFIQIEDKYYVNVKKEIK